MWPDITYLFSSRICNLRPYISSTSDRLDMCRNCSSQHFTSELDLRCFIPKNLSRLELLMISFLDRFVVKIIHCRNVEVSHSKNTYSNILHAYKHLHLNCSLCSCVCVCVCALLMSDNDCKPACNTELGNPASSGLFNPTAYCCGCFLKLRWLAWQLAAFGGADGSDGNPREGEVELCLQCRVFLAIASSSGGRSVAGDMVERQVSMAVHGRHCVTYRRGTNWSWIQAEGEMRSDACGVGKGDEEGRPKTWFFLGFIIATANPKVCAPATGC